LVTRYSIVSTAEITLLRIIIIIIYYTFMDYKTNACGKRFSFALKLLTKCMSVLVDSQVI
jgi:hypothetical protein